MKFEVREALRLHSIPIFLFFTEDCRVQSAMKLHFQNQFIFIFFLTKKSFHFADDDMIQCEHYLCAATGDMHVCIIVVHARRNVQYNFPPI